MQSKRWKTVIFCYLIIHLTFLIDSEEFNNSKGENMSIKKIEIILDHNLSEKELRGHNPNKLTRDEYIKKHYNNDFKSAQDKAYEDIYYYYLYDKDDKETAQKYFNKLSKERQKKITDAIEAEKKLMEDPRYRACEMEE